MAATLLYGSNSLSQVKGALARRDLSGPLLPYRLISFGLWEVLPPHLKRVPGALVGAEG